jgi:hypothetical protein
LFTAALDLQAFCLDQGWHFCFIGGIAVQRWGVQRYTKDADLTLMTGFRDEADYCRQLLARFRARRADAFEFAQRQRVLFLEHDNGIAFDIALGALDFEERCVARSSPWNTDEGGGLVTCSAEDLIVHKAFAARPQDWADVDGIISMQLHQLDLELILRELAPLAEFQTKEDVRTHLAGLFKQHNLG